MRTYEFKRGHRKTLEEIEKIMRDLFGNVERRGDRLQSKYGGLENIEVWIENKKLAVETRSRNVDEDTAMKTIKVWNEFLFKVTGYTAKERKKKMMK